MSAKKEPSSPEELSGVLAQDLSFHDVQELCLESLARATGVDRSVFDEPGTTAVGEADRAGTGVASAYLLERHMVIRCDPAITKKIRSRFDPQITPTLHGFELQVADIAKEIHGSGYVHVLEQPADWLPSVDVRTFDSTDTRDLQLIGELVAADPEGADDAEIEIDDLDTNIVGIESDGRMVAYASERPWETNERFGDVGVLAHPEHRREELSLRATHALCQRMLAMGRLPLYRCNATNTASKALADRSGFVEVTRLCAVTLAD